MVKFRIYAMYCCMLCGIVSCAVKPKAEEHTVPNSVVVIFKDAPVQASTKRFGSSLMIVPESTVEYVDSAVKRVLYIPPSTGYDTIVVPAYNGYAEFAHRNQVLEDIYYQLKAGDTVLFTYGEDLRPQLQSLTNESNTALYNLPFFDKRAVQPTGWATHSTLNESFYRKTYDLLLNKDRYKGQEWAEERMKYAINLDSLNIVYDAYIADFSRVLYYLQMTNSIPPVYVDYYRRQIANQRVRKAIFYEASEEDLPQMTDSLMHYISYYKQALKYKAGMRPANKWFDAIVADTLLQPLARKAILHDIMAKIESDDFGWHAYAPELKKTYREKYMQLTGDSTFSYQAVSAESIVEGEYSNDLVLKSLDGKQQSYADILAKYKGKVIYVDFWASWCGPCRAGMPAAKELREAYKGKDVVFLYLAVNDTESAWRGAVKSMETEYLGENYMVLNTSESKFLAEIKHRRIPRLLLYNRLGKLVNLDAPRPESEEIRAELNSLL